MTFKILPIFPIFYHSLAVDAIIHLEERESKPQLAYKPVVKSLLGYSLG